MSFEFDDDTDRIDRARVLRWLAEESYWAAGRTRELHDRAMAGSRNYGMYDAGTGTQVAYARVITDGATFAWLCDVFVSSSVRGQGVGKALIAGIIGELEPLELRRMMLVTSDAHGLYGQYGFEPVPDPERLMVHAHH